MELVIQNNKIKIQPYIRYPCPIHLGLRSPTVLKITDVCLVKNDFLLTAFVISTYILARPPVLKTIWLLF